MRTRLAILICVASIAARPDGRWRIIRSRRSSTTSKPVKLTGTVTKVEWANPHIWFFMDVKNQDGSVSNWGFEMGGTGQLVRAGWKRDSMKIGDVVTVDARRARDGSTAPTPRPSC